MRQVAQWQHGYLRHVMVVVRVTRGSNAIDDDGSGACQWSDGATDVPCRDR